MSGDDLVPQPHLVATRAITIDAPASAIWPWLVQMGYGRAGWYSYDWLDNAGIHVETIIPAFQQLQVGDLLRTDPSGGFTVEAVVAHGKRLPCRCSRPQGGWRRDHHAHDR